MQMLQITKIVFLAMVTLLLQVIYDASVTRAADICLLLSPFEEAAIRQALDKRNLPKKHLPPSSLRLNGIIFNNETFWTIWLNDQAISYGENVKDFRIIRVTDQNVELLWTVDDETHHQIILRAGETFIPARQ
jgi:hypothetical protein